jgi:8-oxo-dGTP diphosphatase
MKNTTLCYIEKDSSYLMLHRIKNKKDANYDKWIGIGGKFKDKESPEECIIREVQEETGLTLENLYYRGIVTFVSDVYETEYMHLFKSNSFTGNIKECDEGVLEWVKKEKMYSLPLWEGDYIFLDLIEKDTPFFSLKLEYSKDTLVKAFLNGERIK